MNKNLQKIAGVALSSAVFLGFATLALAEEGKIEDVRRSGDSKSMMDIKPELRGLGLNEIKEKKETKRANTVEGLREKQGEAIMKRIEDLKKLEARIAEMKRVSDATKTTLSASLQAEIKKLEDLKTSMMSETDMAKLKELGKQIVSGSRIYALVEPQTRIFVAIDKVNQVATMLTALTPKLETRIAAHQASGKDVTALNAALADFKAKIADATTQASIASTKISGLTPDGGDKAKMTANNEALKSARSALKTANEDLQSAQKDVKIITKGLRAERGEMKKKVEVEDNDKDKEKENETSGSGSTQ